MQVNVRGRVKNTHLYKGEGLHPLFEAIINSMEAIQDLGDDVSEHHVTIRILRDDTLFSGTDDAQRVIPPVHSFEIIDDGIGFNDEGFRAFNEADTERKATRGGKGVGRFLWLKAFEKVEIDSVYGQNGERRRRTFEFSLAPADGITDLRETVVEPQTNRQTTVRLLDIKSEYASGVPKNAETIAQKIVEHCLEHFILANMPTIAVHDALMGETLDLDTVYDALVTKAFTETIQIRGEEFFVTHLMLDAGSSVGHRLSYCANQRVVHSDAPEIPDLPNPLKHIETGKPVVYAGYVASSYLDDHVNQERTGFHVASSDGQQTSAELSRSEIQNGVVGLTRSFLAPYTDQARTQKVERVERFVADQAPEYRHILTHHRDAFDRIPADASDRALDLKLHEIQREIEASLRSEAVEFLDAGAANGQMAIGEEQLAGFSKWWEEYNDLGKANLAKYIVQRRLTLSLLEKSLNRLESGKYPPEEVVHQIIFPMRKTSDEITYEQHNLWVIDEKLSYHWYLASDISLKGNRAVQSESDSRPDLLMFFDHPIAVVDGDAPYNSGVVIFEFKRPMRNDYGDDDNPIQQVLRYVQQIKEGKELTKDGRPFEISSGTPFYCYVVCDLTERLREQAGFAGLRMTPDGSGFFGYNDAIGTYMEIVGFEKLVRDANRRNRILFNKLNLPPALNLPSNDATSWKP